MSVLACFKVTSGGEKIGGSGPNARTILSRIGSLDVQSDSRHRECKSTLNQPSVFPHPG